MILWILDFYHNNNYVEAGHHKHASRLPIRLMLGRRWPKRSCLSQTKHRMRLQWQRINPHSSQFLQKAKPKLHHQTGTGSLRRHSNHFTLLICTNSHANLDLEHQWKVHLKFLQTIGIVGRLPRQVLHIHRDKIRQRGNGRKL